MKTILFQGDSVTDCLRSREIDRWMGQGYALIVGGRLGYEHPGKYNILNRGVSGDRVVDIYARCKEDCWNLEPDYLSVLIGVNDVWHELARQNGVDANRYENIYRLFLKETIERLPNCRIILIEPFCLHGTNTDELGYEAFRAEVDLRREVVGVLAQEFHLPLLRLQDTFEELAKAVSPEYWLLDGVHPTVAGHGMIAEKWLELFHSVEAD